METQTNCRHEVTELELVIGDVVGPTDTLPTVRVSPSDLQIISRAHKPIVVPPSLQKTEAAVDPAETRTVQRPDLSRANWQPSALAALAVIAVFGLAIGVLAVGSQIMAVVGLALASTAIAVTCQLISKTCGKVGAVIDRID